MREVPITPRLCARIADDGMVELVHDGEVVWWIDPETGATEAGMVQLLRAAASESDDSYSSIPTW